MQFRGNLRQLKSPSSTMAIAVVLALYFGRNVLTPIALAGLLAVILAPVVRFLEKIRIPRALAIVLVLALIGSGVCAFAWAVTGELIDVVKEIPSYRDNIHRKVLSIQA